MFTFRERVKDFWAWFPDQVDSVRSALASENPPEALSGFVEEIREKLGGLSWVFGPGESEGALSFTVSGEGQKARQLLAHFWLQNAVELPGWDFYASRQPSPAYQLNGIEVQVGEERVGMDTLTVFPEIDEENQQVDLTAWHPVFEHLDEQQRMQILFLMLDEALGEFGTQNRLGDLNFAAAPEAMPLIALPEWLDKLWAEKEWSNLSPLETYSGYQGQEPTDEFVRADSIAGFTCLPHVVFEYLGEGQPMEEDPIAGTGAELVFVQLKEVGAQNRDDALEYRAVIEESLAKNLAGGGGYVTGAATGVHHAYVDLIIFDDERSRVAIRDAVGQVHQGEFEILPFTNSTG